ncbi:tRNA (guanine(10)-N(2))-dimethyltransferase [Candidatus Woesearchaeota archaeon]|nr:tRNA (guanine(10)-N(2))-dimethyltransferase [Candidatus Woesearchaeota archaeon]|tara:strand:- start:2278 stop:3369 length:1092 start_codon:yes stop_codon:yes gene_type:complete
MKSEILEGKAKIKASKGKITRKMPVFYNPDMKLNRDVSVLLLKSIKNNKMKIADPLAASGVRSIRFLLELNKSKVKEVFINDASATAINNVKSNLKLNKLNKSKKVTVANEEANMFLLENRPFDYIDIDPFGTPVGFLDAATKSLSRNAILAVTATDTAALAGTAQKACVRKYWAVPLKNYLMHEFGLRILIRRVQLAAASNEKALIPVFSYSKLHYMRVFFRCGYKTRDVDEILKQHNHISYCTNCLGLNCNCKNKKVVLGPVWIGDLFDAKLAADIYKNNSDDSNNSFLKTIVDESKISTLGFYDTHELSKKLKLQPPKLDALMQKLKKRGFKAARTHLSGNGVKTNASSSVIIELLKKFS